MSITLKDVAKLANVDVCSVSRTLSKHPLAMSLREETRERIFEAAMKLGYRRNLFAASIRLGNNPTIAIITDEILLKHPYGVRLLIGFLESASDINYAIKLYNANNLEEVLNNILSFKIKMVLCASQDHSKREQLALLCRQHSLNLVFLYEHPHCGFPTFGSDNFNLMYAAVEHVILKGHRRIAFVCGEYLKWFYMQERYNAYLAVLKKYSLEPDLKWIIFEIDPGDSVEKLLALPARERPTAFVCIGDGFALDTQRRAFRRGLRIPRDVSVTGFGGDPYCDLNVVPLTTVIEDHEQIGKSALQFLLEGKSDLPMDEVGAYRCKGKFVERESVFDLRNTEQ